MSLLSGCKSHSFPDFFFARSFFDTCILDSLSPLIWSEWSNAPSIALAGLKCRWDAMFFPLHWLLLFQSEPLRSKWEGKSSSTADACYKPSNHGCCGPFMPVQFMYAIQYIPLSLYFSVACQNLKPSTATNYINIRLFPALFSTPFPPKMCFLSLYEDSFPISYTLHEPVGN